MHEPTSQEIAQARALVEALSGGSDSEVCFAGQINGWLVVAQRRGEVRRPLAQIIAGARMAYPSAACP